MLMPFYVYIYIPSGSVTKACKQQYWIFIDILAWYDVHWSEHHSNVRHVSLWSATSNSKVSWHLTGITEGEWKCEASGLVKHLTQSQGTRLIVGHVEQGTRLSMVLKTGRYRKDATVIWLMSMCVLNVLWLIFKESWEREEAGSIDWGMELLF